MKGAVVDTGDADLARLGQWKRRSFSLRAFAALSLPNMLAGIASNSIGF